MSALRKKVGLALGGGVAKGLAHIGVVKALLELGVPIDCVAGTSAGSLVGALVASAMSPTEMEALARSTRWRDIARPVVPRLGLLDAQRLEQLLVSVLGDRRIEDLPLPFAAVATDLETGKKVVLREGPIAPAVRASCAMPGIFVPVTLQGRLLVDGGVVDNVPVGAARQLGADYVIAVDLSGSLDTTPVPRNVLGILMRSYEIMLHEKRATEVAGADVVIRPRVERLGPVNLEAAEAYIEAGWKATVAQREVLLDLVEELRPRSFLRYVDPRAWLGRRTRRGA
ncbi:MAG: patatin-like phospholipase family protein [Firmicutes bacterium]|nr:patatin-like phospholipase family protein [Bacillota bacterium]